MDHGLNSERVPSGVCFNTILYIYKERAVVVYKVYQFVLFSQHDAIYACEFQ